MEDHPGSEAISEAVPHPFEVRCVALTRGAGRLDLDTHDTVGSNLRNDVYFLTSLFGTQVVELVALCRYDFLRP